MLSATHCYHFSKTFTFTNDYKIKIVFIFIHRLMWSQMPGPKLLIIYIYSNIAPLMKKTCLQLHWKKQSELQLTWRFSSGRTWNNGENRSRVRHDVLTPQVERGQLPVHAVAWNQRHQYRSTNLLDHCFSTGAVGRGRRLAFDLYLKGLINHNSLCFLSI